MLQERQNALFWDDTEGGWFSTTGTDPTVLLRLKEDYDGAEPAPSSVSVLNLLTLSHLLGGGNGLDRAERTLARYGPRIGAAARVIPMMIAGLSTWHAGKAQIVVVGQRTAQDTQSLLAEAARHYRPFAVVVPVEPGTRQQELSAMLPFVGPMSLREGRAAAYVCHDFTCRQPVTEPEALAAQL